ncbi:MAG: tetratricopeptide repeat protein [Planctomycetota bacterium]
MRPLIRAAGIVILGMLALTNAAFSQPNDAGDEAIELLRQVHQATRENYGPDHPKTFESTRQLAKVLAASRRADEAAALLRDTVALSEKRWGARHPETVELKTALAHLLLMSSADIAKKVELAEPIDPRTLGREGSRRRVASAIRSGLAWLERHQADDGRWDADAKGQTDFPDGGGALNDIGVTGLSLLALMGDESSSREGGHEKAINRGLAYLIRVQDDDGLIGGRVGQHYMYNHGIASLALCEALLSGHEDIRPACQRAVNFIHKSRNPYAAWRYDSPPSGDNDTSVTGWMLRTLATAKKAKLDVDEAAIDGGLSWIEQATDPETGRTGYNSRGGVSARETGMMDEFPPDAVEAMTAVGLNSRMLFDRKKNKEVIAKGAKLLMKSLPSWNEKAGTCDMTYWHFGTLASRHLGTDLWRRWSSSLLDAVLPHQREGGEAVAGSWDPVGPWGASGGRVYSTATMVLSLQETQER